MVFERIKEIIADRLEIDPDQITLESSFEDLDVDSLYLVEIMMAIEEEYDIIFDDTEDFKTVADIVEYTENRAKISD